MFNTRENVHITTEISLPKNKLWQMDGDRRGDVIRCLNGTLWITQEGDLKDNIVDAGKSFWVTRRGSVVVQALENSQFIYSLIELDSQIENNIQPIRSTPNSRLTHTLR